MILENIQQFFNFRFPCFPENIRPLAELPPFESLMTAANWTVLLTPYPSRMKPYLLPTMPFTAHSGGSHFLAVTAGNRGERSPFKSSILVPKIKLDAKHNVIGSSIYQLPESRHPIWVNLKSAESGEYSCDLQPQPVDTFSLPSSNMSTGLSSRLLL